MHSSTTDTGGQDSACTPPELHKQPQARKRLPTTQTGSRQSPGTGLFAPAAVAPLDDLGRESVETIHPAAVVHQKAAVTVDTLRNGERRTAPRLGIAASRGAYATVEDFVASRTPYVEPVEIGQFEQLRLRILSIG